MKNKFLIINILIIFLFFCSCSSKNELEAQTMEYSVACELSNINNIENLDDETIKALSIIIRTKQYENDEYYTSNTDVNSLNPKLLEISNQTKKIIIVSNDDSNIDYCNSKSSLEWNKKIEKSDLLDYLDKNNVSISNVSNLLSNTDSDGLLNSISIGGTKISYDELKNNFDLKSNNITKIEKNQSLITFYGKGINDNIFEIEKANDLAKNNYKNDEIIRHFYNNYYYKTI